MTAPRFTRLTARAVALLDVDVDTDQIIPARYLTTTSREGLGPHAFQDWRYGPDGAPVADFAVNRGAVMATSLEMSGPPGPSRS